GDARQTAGDVHRAGGFTRLTREHVAGLDLLAVGDFNTSLRRQVVEVEDLAVRAFDRDARMPLALVLDDDELGLALLGAAGTSLAFFLETDGFAFFDVLVADDTAFLGKDRGDVRIPDDELLARLDLLAVADHERGAIRHLV